MRAVYACMLVGLLSGCGGTWVKPGASSYDFEQDKRYCQYEAKKYSNTPVWGTGVGSGIEEAMREADLTKECLQYKGWSRM